MSDLQDFDRPISMTEEFATSRRFRAVLGIAMTWAVAWLPIGLALASYADSRPPQPSDVISRPVPVALFVTAWTAWGSLSGAAFALVLRLADRHKTFDKLSLARMATWGALGAAALPLVLLAVDVTTTDAGLRGYGWEFPLLILSVSAALGAGCAAATLTLARRSIQ